MSEPCSGAWIRAATVPLSGTDGGAVQHDLVGRRGKSAGARFFLEAVIRFGREYRKGKMRKVGSRGDMMFDIALSAA